MTILWSLAERNNNDFGIIPASIAFACANTSALLKQASLLYIQKHACLSSLLLGSALIPLRNGDIYGKTDIKEYTIFEVKQHLAGMEKQYGKEAIERLLGEERANEIKREFEKEVTLRLEPYWKDIRTTNTAVSGLVFAYLSNTYFEIAAPNVMFRNTSCKPLWTICCPTFVHSLSPKKANASLKNEKPNGKRKR